tara:strand:- start:1378 stop:1527 length:150 start_codon:yes stop_codon:yes gene_type:complete
MTSDEQWLKLRIDLIKLIHLNLDNGDKIKNNNIMLQLKSIINRYDIRLE